MARSLLPVLAGALLLFGCTAGHYRRSADKETYGIVQQYERQIFGHTNAFTIDTPYSARKPEEIPPGELIEGRLQTGRRKLTIAQSLDLAVNAQPPLPGGQGRPVSDGAEPDGLALHVWPAVLRELDCKLHA